MVIVGRMCRFIQPVLLGWIAAFAFGATNWSAKANEVAIPPDKLLQFNIPAQPLDAALKAYSIATRIEVFYNAALVDRRLSQDVAGSFTPSAALQKLLEKTGYMPQLTSDGSLTIVSEPVARRPAAEIMAQRLRYEGYLAAVQAEVSAALCAAPAGVMVGEDVLLRIWLAANGRISRAEVFDKPALQADRIAALVGRVNAGVPPANMPQPVTLAIFPPSTSSSECHDAFDDPVVRTRFAPSFGAAQ